MATVDHECFDDPWMIERSRAMNAEMDASPQQDHGTIWAIFKRHRTAAEEDDPERAERLGGWLDEGLKRAALLDHPTNGRWGLLEVAEWPADLEALLAPIRKRQQAEFEEVLEIHDRHERTKAMLSQAAQHNEERRVIIEQWSAERHRPSKDA